MIIFQNCSVHCSQFTFVCADDKSSEYKRTFINWIEEPKGNSAKTMNCSKEPPPPRKLKIFQLTQRNFAMFGVDRTLLLQPYPFNTKICIGMLTAVYAVISNLLYLIFEAETFNEFAQYIFLDSSAIFMMLLQVICILNVKQLFQLIDSFENFINKSE